MISYFCKQKNQVVISLNAFNVIEVKHNFALGYRLKQWRPRSVKKHTPENLKKFYILEGMLLSLKQTT